MADVRSLLAYVPSMMLSAFAAVLLLIESYVSGIPIQSHCDPGTYCLAPVGTIQAINQLENALLLGSVILFAASLLLSALVWTFGRRTGKAAAVSASPGDSSSHA
jgi:hypothetical protein